MKYSKYFSLLIASILITSNIMPKAPKGTPESGPHMPATMQKQLADLNKAFENDDITALKTFIKNNPTPPFQWNELYPGLPQSWGDKTQTPLSAAVWLGAHKCVAYLLKHNIGNIKVSFTMPSFKGPKYTPLFYAQNPPAKKSRKLAHQKDANYTKIVATLKKYGAKK